MNKYASHNDPVEILGRIVRLIEKDDQDTSDQIKKQKGSDKQLLKEIELLSSLPAFKEYHLKSKDTLVIAHLWANHLTSPLRGLSWNDLCLKIGMDIYDTNNCLSYIEDLYQRKIICIESHKPEFAFFNPFDMLENEIKLRKDILIKVFNCNVAVDIDKHLADRWDNDDIFFRDLNLCLKTIIRYYGVNESILTYNSNTETIEAVDLLPCMQPLLDRLNKASESLNIVKAVRQHKLDITETIILLLMIYFDIMASESIEAGKLIQMISRNEEEYNHNAIYFHPSSKLFSSGLLRLIHESSIGLVRDIEIAPGLERALRGGSEKVKNKNDQKYIELLEMIDDNKFFEILETTQKINDLILSAHDKQILQAMINKHYRSDRNDLSHWGFNKMKVDHLERHKGLIALFYGVSGTGKTYAAGAIANELERPLVSVNTGIMRNSFYGQTEIKVQKTFRLMQQMVIKLQNPPVFLLNEADQIVHKRADIIQSTDCTENAIQNIMLEEIENFPGIMILTTNLENIIDEAYFRRFNIKMKFSFPDKECRKKLWQLHLHQDIPGSDTIDLDLLASRYLFTGGQISLVIQNACSEAITRKGRHRVLTIDDIIKYSDLEQPWQLEQGGKNIGFKGFINSNTNRE